MTWDVSAEQIAELRESIRQISTVTSLKQVLAEDFPRDCGSLPISGGWGYTMAEAIVFEQSDLPWNRDFVSLEYHIAQKIIYEELIIFRRSDMRFSGIDMKLSSQETTTVDARRYDCLNFNVSCWSDSHWEYLKAEWELNDFGRRIDFDIDGHTAKRNAAKIEYKRQLWFDISNVFGKTD